MKLHLVYIVAGINGWQTTFNGIQILGFIKVGFLYCVHIRIAFMF